VETDGPEPETVSGEDASEDVGGVVRIVLDDEDRHSGTVCRCLPVLKGTLPSGGVIGPNFVC
jgi:hypothetical protein